MSKTAWAMSFGMGLLVGLITAVLWPLGHATPSALADQPAKTEPPRFQVSAFGYGGINPNGATLERTGAYVVDTHDGTVWRVQDNGKLRKLEKEK
jgi:hypothetical protein